MICFGAVVDFFESATLDGFLHPRQRSIREVIRKKNCRKTPLQNSTEIMQH